MTAVYEVRGMTCDHCVAAVRAELYRVDGVQQVDVDLTSGQVTVSSCLHQFEATSHEG